MIVIENWNDLVGLRNDDYWLDINVNFGFGWIRKNTTNETVGYLSTHTFYEKKHKFSSEFLQSFGFNVELKSWG